MEIASLLPLDVFDLIIDTIHSTDGTKYLKVLSLVSKNLCLLARTHMFRRLSLDLPKMKQIYDYIGGGSRQPLPTALSSVRNLHVRALEASPSPVDRKYLEVLRFFTRVIHLHISDWYFQDFDKNDVTRLLGHFGATVATLNLQQSFFDSEVLIFLTPMFPLVNNLSVNPRDLSELETYKIRDADRSKSVEFKGRLEFTCLHPIHDQFLAFINQNCSVVTSIIVYYCESGGKLQELFDLQGGNLTFVDVGVPGGGGKFLPVHLFAYDSHAVLSRSHLPFSLHQPPNTTHLPRRGPLLPGQGKSGDSTQHNIPPPRSHLDP